MSWAIRPDGLWGGEESVIRVALLSTDLRPTSGWGTLTYYLCRALVERGDIHLEVLLPSDAPDYGTLPFEARVRRILPPWVMSFRPLPHRMLAFLFPRISVKADVIHAIVEFPYGILAARLAKRIGIPYLISGQGTYSVVPLLRLPDRRLYRPALLRADAITVPSGFTADAMRAAAAADLNIRTIRNPVDLKRFQTDFDPQLVREKMNLPLDARIILSVGAIKPRKGFDVLVRAFAKLLAEESNVHLVIVGEGSTVSMCELAEALGVRSKVRFLGGVSESDLVDLYRSCEVFALLPRIENWHFEGFGLVFLEAAACGKPVVATCSGGVPDAVRHGETGILVPEDDPDAAASAIVHLLRDKSSARKMGLAGRRWARAHSWSAYASQIVETYREVLNGL